MSGRDLKQFVLNHRANSTGLYRPTLINLLLMCNCVLFLCGADKLVNRFLSCDTSSAVTYRRVDYDQLQAEAQDMKTKAASTLGKLQKIARVSKRGREEHILKRHRMMWEREHSRLLSARQKLERQMETLMETHTELKGFVKTLERQLDEDRCEFHQNTVQPVFDLRLDLQAWVKEVRQGRSRDVRRKNEEIKEVVKSVKEQQESVLDLLSAEQVALEGEIRDLMKWHLDEDFAGTCWDVEDNDDANDDYLFGVPGEVWELACPSESLRSDVIREFQQLDGKYLMLVEELKENYGVYLR